MRRAALLCIALAMAVSAPQVAAQPAVPSEPPTPPPASELPPPVPQGPAEAPPPFPHYPARAPREHDPNYHPSKHSHHKAKAKTHHKTTAHHKAGKTRHKTTAHHKAKRQYFSKRTIRQCHAMTYKKLMKYKNCRTMMKQDLETAERRRHRSSSHHRGPTHHHKARHKHR